MSEPIYRYDLRKDGSGTWEVVDLQIKQTANLHGIPLRSLTLDVAADSARLLNRGHLLSRDR
jgi:hypothetical protein